MNYERLKTLAELLNKQHGDQDRHGFIIAPHNELQITDHKKALIHANRIFHYQPMSDERLGIAAVTKEEPINDNTSTGSYSHIRLEHMDHAALANAETTAMLNEYMEYIKSRIISGK